MILFFRIIDKDDPKFDVVVIEHTDDHEGSPEICYKDLQVSYDCQGVPLNDCVTNPQITLLLALPGDEVCMEAYAVMFSDQDLEDILIGYHKYEGRIKEFIEANINRPIPYSIAA